MPDVSQQETIDWEDARRAAFVQDVLSILTNRPTDLLPFEEVREKLALHTATYRGLLNVPLNKIVGSVGRYRDFNRTFLPRQEELKQRWRRIDRMVTAGSGLPPVSLYQVGDVYFVQDGNHRVSVARQHRAPTIQAYVWEYETPVSLHPDADLETLLIKAAHAAFLKRTGIDHHCPEVSIELTQPDGYEDLLYEIEITQQSLSTIDRRAVPFDEAVTLWCRLRYAPVVEIVQEQGILDHFPNRTAADLYLWLRRNQHELGLRYGRSILLEEAADDLTRRFGQRMKVRRFITELVDRFRVGLHELGRRLAERRRVGTPATGDDLVATRLLSPIRRVAQQTPEYRFRGTTREEWAAWQTEFRHKLWDILGVGERHLDAYTAEELKPRVEERVEVEDGLWRELVWLTTEEGPRVPSYLFVPDRDGDPRPAVVVFPAHGTIEQTAGLKRSFQRGNALALARAGFVTLTMEARGFGRLAAIGHVQLDAAARLVGRTWYGMLVHDGMHGIDYLLTRPEVDPDRIGATGIGSGGALTMYTAALDERIRVALVNSYLGKYVVTSLDETHCPCNDIPGILRYAEMGDVAALIAPRPVLFVNGQRDPSSGPMARGSFAIVHQVYRLLGVIQHAQLIEPIGLGHAFDNQLAIGWFRRWLT